jgi:hypothetical protein
MNPKRISVPVDIKIQVLTEAGYRCAVPTCRAILALDLHHIEEVSEGGGNDPYNLLPLCPTCHALYHRGTIRRESISAWKQLLVSLTDSFGSRVVDDLLLLEDQHEDNTIEFSGDALIHFGRLVAAKLVEYGTVVWNGRIEHQKYRIVLTQKGRQLLDAYRAGDLNAASVASSIKNT